MMMLMLASFRASVKEYARGKTWYWYAPLWVFGLYIFTQLCIFDIQQLPLVLLIPYSINFILHEWAHIFTAFLPPVLTASAGSVSELMLGCGLVVAAFWTRTYFASLFCLLWLNLSCESAGTYMADAVPQQLPLVSLGGALSGQDPMHDWHFVFGQLHLLDAGAFIGNSLRVIGYVAGLFGLIFAARVMHKMSHAPVWANSDDETLLIATRPELLPDKLAVVEDKGFTSASLSDEEPMSHNKSKTNITDS